MFAFTLCIAVGSLLVGRDVLSTLSIMSVKQTLPGTFVNVNESNFLFKNKSNRLFSIFIFVFWLARKMIKVTFYSSLVVYIIPVSLYGISTM